MTSNEEYVRIKRTIEQVDELPKEHPSYGMIKISRTHGGPTSLFGSDIMHNSFLELTISKAILDRSLNNDYHFSKEELISIYLSSAQWAELISSFNTQGVPCTLDYIRGEETIPPPPFVDKTKQFSTEFKTGYEEQINDALSMIKQLSKGLDKDTKLSKKELREIIYSLECKINNIKTNIPFVAKQFNENIESRILNAKLELETYMFEKHGSMGSSNMLGFDTQSFPKLVAIEEDQKDKEGKDNAGN